jgi:hypothetical protein
VTLSDRFSELLADQIESHHEEFALFLNSAATLGSSTFSLLFTYSVMLLFVPKHFLGGAKQ